jgi:hypothetical protein
MTTTDNKNGNNLLLLAILTALITLILLSSCGSRKVNKSQIKEQEQKTEKITLEIETRVTDNTKIIDSSTTDEIEIIPIDNTKPIVVNGQEFKNVKIKRSKKKNNISVAKDVIIQQNVQKIDLKAVKTSKVVEIKQIERKQSFWWLLWLLLLIPIYYVYKNWQKIFIWFI